MTARLGIVEAGHWHTELHVDAFRSVGAEVVGMSEREVGLHPQLAHEYGCPIYTEPIDLIEAAKPDLVVVLGRHDELPDLALAVIDAGVPFVLEKPCAVSSAALQPVVDALHQNARFAAVPLVHRHRDVWDHTPEQATGYGDFRIVTGPPQRYLDWGVPWVLDPAISGGGALRNIGIHVVDAFVSLHPDQDIELVGAAATWSPDYPGIDLRSVALLRAGDSFATIEASYTYPALSGADVEWRLNGDDWYLRDRNDELTVVDQREATRNARTESPPRYHRYARDVLDRLADGRPPAASIHDAFRALEVIDRIYATTTRETPT